MIREYKKGRNVKLSKNFWSREFDCHCGYRECVWTLVDDYLILRLQKERDILKDPILIDSGYRCQRHNKYVGGKAGSYHLIGKAADLHIDGLRVREMLEIFEGFDGLGSYVGRHFIHADVRGYRSRFKEK
jgi:uncharacterized protein YcbK (DUF882 family)